MTRPPPLYPRRRLTALVATVALLSLAVAGLTFVVVTQDETLGKLKTSVQHSDAHRTRDIGALRESDQQLRQVLVAALKASLAEIRRLQLLVEKLGGNPGSFPTSARSAFEQPQPEPGPSGSGGGSRASPSPSSSPRPRPSHSPSPSPSPSPSRTCLLPPPAPCVQPPPAQGFMMRVVTLGWLRAVLRSAEKRLSAAARRSP